MGRRWHRSRFGLNIFLGDDWTATEWPATMGGAACSGYLAATLSRASSRRRTFLQPDLPAAGLMRMFK